MLVRIIVQYGRLKPRVSASLDRAMSLDPRRMRLMEVMLLRTGSDNMGDGGCRKKLLWLVEVWSEPLKLCSIQ